MQKAASVALYKDLIKQLVKFAKSLVIPLEDLQDNVLDGNIAKKAATDIQQVCLPAAVGLCPVCRARMGTSHRLRTRWTEAWTWLKDVKHWDGFRPS